MQLHELRYEHFVNLVHRKVRILNGESAVEAELAFATKLGTGRKGRRDPFSLIFIGPREPVLPQKICTVDIGEELGSLDFFLVPLGPDEDARGMQYEAIFT